MINSALLRKEVQTFIDQNLKTDVARLVLKGSPFPVIEIRAIAQQIKSKQKAEKKLPTWFSTQGILYPNPINLSQSSSEKTAEYKANLVSGSTLIDITGGFGVDDFYFSKKMQQVVHCEQDAELSDLAKHNFQRLTNKNNCSFFLGDGLKYIQKNSEKADWIYIDPSRRTASGKKVYFLDDSQPNILNHLSLLKQKSDKILLKTSPILDLTKAIQQLKTVEEAHIIAVNNEVKELLFIIGNHYKKNPPIKTINILNAEIERFTSTKEDEEQSKIASSSPSTYLYEPNAAILKAGFFKSIAEKFNLFKLAPNTHLYTSNQTVEFPGRRFKIIKVLQVNKRAIKENNLYKANITTRNFPTSVAQIRKKYKIKEGGSKYLFFSRDAKDKKMLIWAEKYRKK